MLYRVVVHERRIYETVYVVEADSPEEAADNVYKEGSSKEVSDHLVDCTSSDTKSVHPVNNDGSLV